MFVWNGRHQRQAADAGYRNVIAIGAPFAYLGRLLDVTRFGAQPRGSGTICFPYHSAEAVQVTNAHHSLIEQIEDVAEGPYTVSIFYQDMSEDVLRIYRDAGWRVVTFGTRSNRLFLVQLYNELLAHRFVVADEIGSALWYGALLKRQVRVLGQRPLVRGSIAHQDLKPRWPAIYGEGLAGDEAFEIACAELGAEALREPEELAVLLGWHGWRQVAARALRYAYDLRAGRSVREGVVPA